MMCSKPPPADKTGLEHNVLNKKLTDAGERDNLKQHIVTALNQTGFREEIKRHIAETIQAKGSDNITVESLMSEARPKVHDFVSDELRTELFNRVTAYAYEHGIDPAAQQ
mmetsp:Transcript_19789/g.35897  ORF Transcript_19789/g.35897 Transcript_19789/m.35897 type:complete len:110 (+) Transcript_19789:39-368(+)